MQNRFAVVSSVPVYVVLVYFILLYHLRRLLSISLGAISHNVEANT